MKILWIFFGQYNSKYILKHVRLYCKIWHMRYFQYKGGFSQSSEYFLELMKFNNTSKCDDN